MSERRSGSVPRRLRVLAGRIDEWRRTRAKQGPMPEELWERAVSLARSCGVYPVVRATGVNYQNLKDRVAEQEEREEQATTARTTAERPARPREERPSSFVELEGGLLGRRAATVTVVEATDRQGAKLTVRLEGGEGLAVESLMDSFWRRGG